MDTRRVILSLIGALMMVGTATAGGPNADPVGAAASGVGDVDAADAGDLDISILDGDAIARVTDGIGSAGEAVGGAASAVGGAIAAAVAAVASFVANAAVATGHGIAAGARGIGVAGVAVGGAAATAAVWLATGVADLTVLAATAVADAVGWMWTTGRLAPPAYQAAAAGTTAAAAAGTGAWRAGWLRKLKALPLLLGPLYARLNREDLLDHPMRADIYERIRAEPGTHTSELARDLDVPWGTLLHHLDKLEGARFVTSQLVAGKKCYFLPGAVPSDERSLLPALKNETAHRIAAYFKANPGASQSDAARDLELSAAIVSWHVKRLTRAGVLERTREGRSMAVSVEPRAAPLIA